MWINVINNTYGCIYVFLIRSTVTQFRKQGEISLCLNLGTVKKLISYNMFELLLEDELSRYINSFKFSYSSVVNLFLILSYETMNMKYKNQRKSV